MYSTLEFYKILHAQLVNIFLCAWFFRFKHHRTDLLFMEKIARWLTNTQVKIKSEVADSNSQAQRLAQALNDLDRRIDACEKPNLDKEVGRPVNCIS